MRLLLDTHALLWALSDPTRLSAAALAALQDLSSEVWVSSASLFEIATKVRLGKLAHPGPLLTNCEWTLARLHASLLAINADHAITAGSLQTPHRDPFDRMLAAQAVREGMSLVTRDPAFATVPDVQVLW